MSNIKNFATIFLVVILASNIIDAERAGDDASNENDCGKCIFYNNANANSNDNNVKLPITQEDKPAQKCGTKIFADDLIELVISEAANDANISTSDAEESILNLETVVDQSNDESTALDEHKLSKRIGQQHQENINENQRQIDENENGESDVYAEQIENSEKLEEYKKELKASKKNKKVKKGKTELKDRKKRDTKGKSATKTQSAPESVKGTKSPSKNARDQAKGQTKNEVKGQEKSEVKGQEKIEVKGQEKSGVKKQARYESSESVKSAQKGEEVRGQVTGESEGKGRKTRDTNKKNKDKNGNNNNKRSKKVEKNDKKSSSKK